MRRRNDGLLVLLLHYGARRHAGSTEKALTTEQTQDTEATQRIPGMIFYMSATLALRFHPQQIQCLAARYQYGGDDLIEAGPGSRTKQRGCFDRDDFLRLCRWKAPRAERHYVQNVDADIRAVTQLALAAKDERLKISLIMALHGVNWPIASALLHFGSVDRYPILDVRSLWSMGVPRVNFYTFDLWWDYTQLCRQLADTNRVTMRTLDRALWQYSKDNQRKIGNQ